MTLGESLDPRSKLTLVMCLSSLAVFADDIFVLLGVLVISALLSQLMGGNPLGAARKLRKLLMFIVAVSLMQSIFSPSGKELVTIANMTLLTTGGLLKGIRVILRMAAILISATIMSTSSSRQIIQGLVQWKLPYEIAFMVSVAIRFLPLLTEELRDSLVAIQLRGIDPKKLPFRKRIRVYSYLLMPVVISTLLKSQQLSMAMECRAFRAYPTRTSYRVLRLAKVDYVVMIVSVAATATTLYIS